MTLSVELYQKILASLFLEEIKLDKNEWLRTDNSKHRIVKLLKGKVPIANLTFEGLVFVVAPYNDKVTIPVNLLKNETDTTVSLISCAFYGVSEHRKKTGVSFSPSQLQIPCKNHWQHRKFQ